jgi:hypothetical protein
MLILNNEGNKKIEPMYSGEYSLPVFFDESETNWYYYDQSHKGLTEKGMKPLICIKKKSSSFEDDVLSKFANRPFTEKELEYIFTFKK